MANPLKGEAQLRLDDGRELTLVFDFEAMVSAEVAYGKPLPKLLADAAGGFVGAQRAMLAGALARHHPGMSLGEVGQILLGDLDAVTDALSRAMENAHPAAEEGKEPGKAPPPPRGKNSGRSGVKPG